MFMSGVGYYYTDTEGIEVVLTKGQSHCYPWHMHTRHWTMGVIRQGAVTLTTVNACQRLCQGQSFCVPPFEAHSLLVEPGSSLLVMCFDAQSALLLNEFPESLLRYIVCLEPEEAKWIADALVPCKHFDFPHIFSDRHPSALGSPLEYSLWEIMRLVLAAPDDPLHIDQMAAHAGYSPWHFLRTFQKTTGMTPHAFQLLCRLRLSRSLLRADTAASIAAVSAGFADQSHMNKVFKRHHGMTPGEFKKASVRLEL